MIKHYSQYSLFRLIAIKSSKTSPTAEWDNPFRFTVLVYTVFYIMDQIMLERPV